MLESLFAHYTSVSKRLGLAFEDGRIHGALEGVPLQMWFGPHQVHIAALVHHPAPFDLSIATKGLVDKLKDLFGGHGDQIGDAVFDERFAVKTSSSSKLAAFLDANARSALLEMAKQGLHPSVDANSVHLWRFSSSAISDSEETIEHDFRAALYLARTVGDSFRRGH